MMDATASVAQPEIAYQKWIKKQLEKRSAEFSETHPICIFCGTWNVGALPLDSDFEDIRQWLFADNATNKTGSGYDIYSIGLQEMVGLNVMNVLMTNRTTDEAVVYWIQKLTSAFELEFSSVKYRILIEKHMVGIFLVIFVKESLFASVSDIRSTMVATGALGIMGNKGAVAVRFELNNTSICIVNAHFHSDKDSLAIRNQDYHTIVDTAVFTCSDLASESSYKDGGMLSYLAELSNQSEDVTIFDHDYVIWQGDLNYRIGEDIDTREVFARCNTGDWEYLKSKDQLNCERANKTVFADFHEGSLTFAPTYKYQPGTDIYECRPDKKLRAPAWCDRVLWHVNNTSATTSNNHAVKLLHYSRANLHHSDHKPVSAVLRIEVRQVVAKALKQVYQQLLHSVDKWVNAAAPKLTVVNRLVDVGTVTCDRRYSAYLEVKNEGSVMAEWLFIPKNHDTTVCKSWLTLQPSDGILAPEEGVQVVLGVELSAEEAYEELRNTKNNRLEDVLILRVLKGSDLFCVVSADLEEKCADNVRQLFEKKKIGVDMNTATREEVTNVTKVVCDIVANEF